MLTAEHVVQLSPGLPHEMGSMAASIKEPGTLADMMASTINSSPEEKQQILEIQDSTKRLKAVTKLLHHQLEILELGDKIQSQVKGDMDKRQREYYLRQQLKAIKEELGDDQVSVACIGPAGEKLIRYACVMNDKGRAAGRCGFGAIMGSKNLKAISTIGTGSAPIADPQAFMDTRLWFSQFQWNVDNPRKKDMMGGFYFWINGSPGGANVTNNPYFGTDGLPLVPSRAVACASSSTPC